MCHVISQGLLHHVPTSVPWMDVCRVMQRARSVASMRRESSIPAPTSVPKMVVYHVIARSVASLRRESSIPALKSAMKRGNVGVSTSLLSLSCEGQIVQNYMRGVERRNNLLFSQRGSIPVAMIRWMDGHGEERSVLEFDKGRAIMYKMTFSYSPIKTCECHAVPCSKIKPRAYLIRPDRFP